MRPSPIRSLGLSMEFPTRTITFTRLYLTRALMNLSSAGKRGSSAISGVTSGDYGRTHDHQRSKTFGHWASVGTGLGNPALAGGRDAVEKSHWNRNGKGGGGVCWL